MNGTNLIRQERVRQVRKEGWSALHDARWRDGELVRAAICYALTGLGDRLASTLFWPWDPMWFKPRYDERDLVKAGALIAAEIDRQRGVRLGKTAVGPKVVCLCGSTRFWREFQRAGLEETMKGNIVLSIGAASGTDDEHFGNLPQEEYDRVKTMLDELHLRKIDMADEVLILDVDGYIGESTGRELMYAVEHGKEIRFLEPVAPKSGWSLTPPDKELPDGHKWQAFAYLEPGEGWFLNWDELGTDGDPISNHCPEIEWPFPVNYARTEDFAALGFEIV